MRSIDPRPIYLDYQFGFASSSSRIFIRRSDTVNKRVRHTDLSVIAIVAAAAAVAVSSPPLSGPIHNVLYMSYLVLSDSVLHVQ